MSTINKQNIVDNLNRILKADNIMLETMLENRQVVNDEYMASDFIFCQDKNDDLPTVNVIGILNSILDNDGYRVAAVYDGVDNTKLVGFSLIKLK